MSANPAGGSWPMFPVRTRPALVWPLSGAVNLSVGLPAQGSILRRTGEIIPSGASGSLAFGGLVGDGDQDLLSLSGGVFLNDGYGVFDPHPTPSAVIASLALQGLSSAKVVLADLDDDAVDDALLLPAWATPILWRNQGTGVFYDASANLPPLMGPPYFSGSVIWDQGAVADFDADGDRDIFLAPTQQGANPNTRMALPPALLINAGALVFVGAPAQIPWTPLAAGTVFADDWDGDGDRDLLAFRHYGAAYLLAGIPYDRLLLNNGAGYFSAAPATPNVNSSQPDVRAGDLNGDGRPDLMFGLSNGGGLQEAFVLNLGGGLFSGLNWTTLASYGALQSVTDLDQDGRAEVLRTTIAGLAVSTLDATGTSFVTQQVVPVATPYWGQWIMTADLDADSDPDVLVHASGNRPVLLSGNQGLLTEVRHLLPSMDFLYSMAAGDIDGDGDPDIFGCTGAPGNQVVRILANDGTGLFGPGIPEPPLSIYGCVSDRIHPVDADSDGDLDLLHISWGQALTLWLNHGAAGWLLAPLSGIGPGTRTLTTGDLDGDGDLDVVLGRYDGNQIIFNVGSGTFGTPVALPGAATQTSQFGLADIENDGDLDILEANSASIPAPPAGLCRLLVNGGGSTFVLAPFPAVSSSLVAAGDLDGDGDPDFVLWDRVLRNDGSTVFTSVPQPMLPISVGDAVLADMDGDGDLDLVGVDGNLPLAVRLNDGTGVFQTVQTVPRVVSQNDSFLVGDLDRDGDPDVFDGGPRLWQNSTRQLVARGFPTPGGRVVMELQGPSSSPWWLFASLGRADFDYSPFGRVLIDPASLAPAGAGVLDPAGQASLAVQVPVVVRLIGTTIYWQGVAGSPARITNALGTTIIDG